MKKRLLPIDALRGIAACAIAFFWHYQHFGYIAAHNTQPFFNQLSFLYIRGWNLVDLFFVLSGFIIMYTYADRIAGSHVSFRDFAVRRLSKLYPLHFITLCLVAILQLARIADGQSSYVYGHTDVFHFFLNVLLIQTGFIDLGYSFNGPSWVISLLLYMYILLFFVLTKLRGNHYLVFMSLVLLGLIGIRSGWPSIHITRAITGFFAGCLTFGVYQMMIAKNRNRDFSLWVAVLLILGIVFDMESSLSTYVVYGESLPLLVWPAVILTVLNTPVLNRLLSLKPLVYLGNISYSIFLIHFPIQLIMFTLILYFELEIRSIYVFYIYVVTTLLLSALSHKYLELPLQNLFRRAYLRAEPVKETKV